MISRPFIAAFAIAIVAFPAWAQKSSSEANQLSSDWTGSWAGWASKQRQTSDGPYRTSKSLTIRMSEDGKISWSVYSRAEFLRRNYVPYSCWAEGSGTAEISAGGKLVISTQSMYRYPGPSRSEYDVWDCGGIKLTVPIGQRVYLDSTCRKVGLATDRIDEGVANIVCTMNNDFDEFKRIVLTPGRDGTASTTVLLNFKKFKTVLKRVGNGQPLALDDESRRPLVQSHDDLSPKSVESPAGSSMSKTRPDGKMDSVQGGAVSSKSLTAQDLGLSRKPLPPRPMLLPETRTVEVRSGKKRPDDFWLYHGIGIAADAAGLGLLVGAGVKGRPFTQRNSELTTSGTLLGIGVGMVLVGATMHLLGVFNTPDETIERVQEIDYDARSENSRRLSSWEAETASAISVNRDIDEQVAKANRALQESDNTVH